LFQQFQRGKEFDAVGLMLIGSGQANDTVELKVRLSTIRELATSEYLAKSSVTA
jgi:hypothetical protein